MSKVEYRVKPITRFIVTRHVENTGEDVASLVPGTDQKGEYDNPDIAYEVAYALCKEEHERLGWEPGDERIQYPKPLVRCDLSLTQAIGMEAIPPEKGYVEATQTIPAS